MPNPPLDASLWERRMSTTSNPSPPSSPDPIRLDIDPFDTYPPTSTTSKPQHTLRRRASGRKPPIMPPLKPAIPRAVHLHHDHDHDHDTADPDDTTVIMSPVSSFLGSAPGSPRDTAAHSELDALMRRVAAWDGTLTEMEMRVERAWAEVRRVTKRLQRAGVRDAW